MSTTFLNRNKTNILLAGLCILFAWLIINWFRYLMNNYFILKGTNSTSPNTSIIRSAIFKEGFEQNIYDVKRYDNQYTHSIDLPINTDKSCSNFCGPDARCSQTKNIQCSTDSDCWQYGCQSMLKPPPKKVDDGPKPDYDAGILTYNQTPQYSSLTTDMGSEATVIDANAEVPRSYDGIPVWQETYDQQARMVDDELAYQYSSEPQQYRTAPAYPVSTTITGVFYDIGPTPSNATLS